jgi:hypothetical protein
MSLAQISNFPETAEEFAQWSFAHAAFHFDVDQAISRLHLTTLPQFVLDPFDPHNNSTWLYNHAFNHNARNTVLGIQGYDLTQADWSDKDSMLDWFNAHFEEEQRAAQILNLG